MKTIVVARRTPISRFNIVQLHRAIQQYVRKNLDPALKWLEDNIEVKIDWDRADAAELVRDLNKHGTTQDPGDRVDTPSPFFTPANTDDGSAHQLRTTKQVLVWLEHQDDPDRMKLFRGLIDENGSHFIEDLLEGAWLESMTL